jgi:hypothetical protein
VKPCRGKYRIDVRAGEMTALKVKEASRVFSKI